MIVAGAVALAAVLDGLHHLRGGTLLIFGAVAVLAHAPLVVAGIMLLRRLPGSHLAGALSWLPTLLILQAGKLSYAALPLPAMAWKLWPDFGFSASAGPVFTAIWHQDEQPFAFGCNVIALLACSYLGERAWRRAVRLRRMRRLHHSH